MCVCVCVVMSIYCVCGYVSLYVARAIFSYLISYIYKKVVLNDRLEKFFNWHLLLII